MKKQHRIEAPLLARLDDLRIKTVMHRHPSLHTVEESQGLPGPMPSGHIKNCPCGTRSKIIS
jgi:hypothetical protein